MKELGWSIVKQMNAVDLERGECIKVTKDGTMVFYIVIKPESVMRDRIEALCSMIDASKGF